MPNHERLVGWHICLYIHPLLGQWITAYRGSEAPGEHLQAEVLLGDAPPIAA
jgi:hypothetical protein